MSTLVTPAPVLEHRDDHDRGGPAPSAPLRLTAVRATIADRVLATWRVDPVWVQRRLPVGLEPLVVEGHALAGLCLLSLRHARPAVVGPRVGASARNTAVRAFVRHERAGRLGVAVLRRHTSAPRLAAIGRPLLPNVAAAADVRFERSAAGHLRVTATADDAPLLDVRARPAGRVRGSVVGDTAAVSALNREANAGWSVDHRGRVRAVRLDVDPWGVLPAAVVAAELHGGYEVPGELDHVLLMRDRDSRWTAER